jgi:hypothetical protein
LDELLAYVRAMAACAVFSLTATTTGATKDERGVRSRHGAHREGIAAEEHEMEQAFRHRATPWL